jgi:hypothetical protein
MQMHPMVSFKWTTPDGKAVIFITETDPIEVSVTIGKSGTSLASLLYALTHFINETLKHKSIDEVIDILQDITTARSVYNTNGVQCRSTPEAIAFALLEYKKLKAQENAKSRKAS